MSIELIVALLGTVVGVAGLGVAVWTHAHPPRRLKLAYQTDLARHFDEARLTLPPDAAMTFDGGQVRRLATTTVILWNAGTEAMRGEDLVAADPLRISIAEGRVLSHQILHASSAAANIRIVPSVSNGDLEIHYRYLNPGDGVAVEVLHDGLATKVTGTAKGVKDGPVRRHVKLTLWRHEN